MRRSSYEAFNAALRMTVVWVCPFCFQTIYSSKMSALGLLTLLLGFHELNAYRGLKWEED